MKSFGEYLTEANELANYRGKSGPTRVPLTQTMSGPLTQEVQVVTANLINHLQGSYDAAKEGDEKTCKMFLNEFFAYLQSSGLQELHRRFP